MFFGVGVSLLAISAAALERFLGFATVSNRPTAALHERQEWGPGSSGTENQRKHELEFALLVIGRGTANLGSEVQRNENVR